MSNTPPVENEHSSEASHVTRGRNLLDEGEPAHRDLRQHVVDLGVSHLGKNVGPSGGWGHAVDPNPGSGKLLAEGFRQANDPSPLRPLGRAWGRPRCGIG